MRDLGQTLGEHEGFQGRDALYPKNAWRIVTAGSIGEQGSMSMPCPALGCEAVRGLALPKFLQGVLRVSAVQEVGSSRLCHLHPLGCGRAD